MINKILLGPVLLLQGKWVRHKTPLLPEPVKVKSGVVGQGSVLRVLLMGDSSAAGVGAEKAEQSLLEQLLAELSQRHQVHFSLLAKTGRTTGEMLQVLHQEKPCKTDVVISALGVNDVTSQVSENRWIKQQQELIAVIKAQYQPQKIILSGLPPMRDFPALPWPLNAYLGNTADQFNDALHQICQSQPDVTFLSLRDFPTSVSAAKDGFHPGPAVYQLWAQRLASKIKSMGV
jgi:lysophospholipase L1-like esterase